jgi:hypothetical protein
MSQRTPTIEGFRTVFRYPSLGLTEVAWRWTFGGAALTLLTLSLFEYLDTLTVTSGDALFLRSRQPLLVFRALAHILAGSGARLAAATVILALALVALWILASSIGRAATIRALLQHFTQAPVLGSPLPAAGFAQHPAGNWSVSSLLGLNFLRTTLVLAGLLAMVSASIIAGFASTPAHPRPGLSFLIFVPLALLVILFWSSMNWFLSLASIFVVRDACDIFGAVSSAVDFCLRRARAVSWSSTVFGTCHLVTLIIASSVVVFPLAFAGLLPGWVVLAAVMLLALGYFAVADFFHVGRLAAYVCILETPEEVYAPAAPSIPLSPTSPEATTPIFADPPSTASGSPGTAWPPLPPSEEDILSDIPMPPGEQRKS